MYKAIIFDFFGVLRTDPYKTWLKKRGQPREGGYLEASQKMDRGEIDTQQFLARLGELTGESPEKIFRDMEAATEVNYDVIAIIDELREKGYVLGLLSNAPSAFIRDLLRQYDLEKYFDHIVVSSEVGLIKPEPEIFQHTLRRMNSIAGETIFIDDSEKNVRAGESLGIQGIVFVSADELSVTLKRLGVQTTR